MKLSLNVSSEMCQNNENKKRSETYVMCRAVVEIHEK